MAAAPAFADYKAGMEALAVRDYSRARVEFEAAPQNGAAIYQLSLMASLGLGEPRDQARAASLLRRAADAGHAAAKLDYAYALANGRGVAKDGAAAIQMLEQLAAEGNVDAMLNLGRALRFGWWGSKRDDVRAVGLFQQAMDRGSDDARTLYAAALISGTGVAKDEKRGADLLRQAAGRGSVAAQVELARVLMWGGGLPKDQPAAVDLYMKAAETASPVAQYGLALAYLNGWGVRQDAATGVRWADAAARQGHAWSQVLLGDSFRTGVGVPRARDEAFYWFTVAARSDSPVVERANERRAMLARDMAQAEIDPIVKRAQAFQPQPGFRPRKEALPPLAHGGDVLVDSVKVDVPAPRGYGNGWQIVEWLQQVHPNDPSLRPLLMVLTRQEDMDRLKLGLPGAYRSIEISRYGAAAAAGVTPALFADLKKQLRGEVEKNVAAGRYRVEKTLRDDDKVYGFVRSGISQATTVEGVLLLLIKQRVMLLRFTGFRPEHLEEVQELLKGTAEDLLSSNRDGLFR